MGFLNPIHFELAASTPELATPKKEESKYPTDVEMLYSHLSTPGIENKFNEAYWDKNGKVWTIGVGQTGKGIEKGTKWTDEQIRDSFNSRAMNNRKILETQYGTVFNAMNDNQKMVVQSLLWNAGPAALDKWPTMRKAMLTSDPNKVPEAIRIFSNEIPSIRKSGGVVVPGLVNRRAKEKKIFDEEPEKK